MDARPAPTSAIGPTNDAGEGACYLSPPAPPPRPAVACTRIAVVLIVDADAQASPLAVCKTAAAAVSSHLPAGACLGVVVEQAAWIGVVPLRRMPDGVGVQRALEALTMHRSSEWQPSLEVAEHALDTAAADRKHVVLVTDRPHLGTGMLEMAMAMSGNGISFSTVVLGPDSDAERRRRATDFGCGRYLAADPVAQLPALLGSDVAAAWR